MPEPGLELEQRHRLLRDEQLRGDRARARWLVMRPRASRSGTPALRHNRGDQRAIEILRWKVLAAETEEHRDGLARLSIEEIRLNRAPLLPRVNRLADERVDRFGEGRSGLIRRYIEQTCRVFANHVLRCGRGTRRASLPADTSDTEPHQLVAAEPSEQPGESQRSDERKGVNRPGVFGTLEPSGPGQVLLFEAHAGPEQLGPQLVGEDAWVWADQRPDGARLSERTRDVPSAKREARNGVKSTVEAPPSIRELGQALNTVVTEAKSRADRLRHTGARDQRDQAPMVTAVVPAALRARYRRMSELRRRLRRLG
jgi:hypothetical protein